MPMDLGAKFLGHFDNDMIVPDAQGAVWQYLDRNMAIADVPGNPGGLGESLAIQVCDGLRCGHHPHISTIFKNQAITFTEVYRLWQIQ